MKFKLYENKSSVRKRNSRYVQGGNTDVFKERLGWWEKRTDIETDQFKDTIFVITKNYEHKPYLVAKIFLGREDLEWLVLQYNNIVDVIEEFVVGREIRIPSKGRVDFNILTKSVISNRL